MCMMMSYKPIKTASLTNLRILPTPRLKLKKNPKKPGLLKVSGSSPWKCLYTRPIAQLYQLCIIKCIHILLHCIFYSTAC